MNMKGINRLLAITSAALLLSGIIFLCLSIFKETKDTTYLCIALADIVLANLFNIIRIQNNKKK